MSQSPTGQDPSVPVVVSQSNSTQFKPTWRHWSALAVLLLLATLMLGLIAEGAVRTRQYLKYGYFGDMNDLYHVDVKTGLRVLHPSTRLGQLSINSMGFRGPEIAAKKSDDSVRIAFIGASTTFCGEINRDDLTWPHLVTEGLKKAFDSGRVDYVNAGVPGYTAQSSLRNLELKLAPLSPDVIVIYHAVNNLNVELRGHALAQNLISSTRIQERSVIGEYSLLWSLASKYFVISRAAQDADATARNADLHGVELGADFKKALTELVERAKRNASVVALATFSTQLRRNQSVREQTRAASSAFIYAPRIALADIVRGLARYNEIIREVAANTGVMIIDAEDSIPGDPEHFYDTVHFTAAGSALMARRVLERLRSDPQVAAVFARSAASSESFAGQRR